MKRSYRCVKPVLALALCTVSLASCARNWQTGTAPYNLALSERRATSAARFLEQQGVSAARIRTMGLGETEPVATNDTDAGRQANRRIEVAIYASKDAQAAARNRAGN